MLNVSESNEQKIALGNGLNALDVLSGKVPVCLRAYADHDLCRVTLSHNNVIFAKESLSKKDDAKTIEKTFTKLCADLCENFGCKNKTIKPKKINESDSANDILSWYV